MIIWKQFFKSDVAKLLTGKHDREERWRSRGTADWLMIHKNKGRF